jgi:hypothetical protein
MTNPFYKYIGKEDHLHIQVTQYLNTQYPKVLWHHSPNEGKRSAFERFKTSVLGVKSGCPDILIFNPIHPFVGLAIELKIKPNKVSSNQKEFLANLLSCGWMTVVCYTFEETKHIIDEYFKK